MMPFLLPLAWLYDAVTRLRNALFDCGVLPQQRFGVPVIAVGNLAVGGTGKTPHTEYLLRLLAGEGRREVAVLSRGYGRRTTGFRLAAPGVTASDVGDEPLQMWQKFPQTTVAVDADRRHGIRCLLGLPGVSANPIVVLDDAFQHRYVKAGLYILLTDYSRRYSRDYILPAGRLRESRRGARRARIIVVTKCPRRLGYGERQAIRRELCPQPDQLVVFSSFGYGRLFPLFAKPAAGEENVSGPRQALVISGIARPGPLHEHLAGQGYGVHPLVFPDHHAFGCADVERMNAAFAKLPAGSVAVTTEKDAVRLKLHENRLSAALKEALLVQPVEACFDDPEEEHLFHQKILSYVTENQRNRRVD